MALDEGISRLIGRIYEGAQEDAVWNRAVDEIVERLEGHFVMVATLDTRHRQFSSTAYHGHIDGRFLDGIAEYETELFRIDPTIDFSTAFPHARHVDTRAIFGAEHRDHPYMRWNRDRLGSDSWHLSYSPPVDDLVFGMSLHPGSGKGGLSDQQQRLARILFEHMDNAKRLALRPPDLEGRGQAALMLDRSGRIAAVSEDAERYLALRDGLAILNRRLVTASRDATARLDRLTRAAAGLLENGGFGGMAAVPRPSGKRAWILSVTPLSASGGPFAAFRPAVLVRIVDPDADVDASAAGRWKALHGLTDAEARLAQALLNGNGTLRAVADELGVAYATARVQLASIFDKTEVSSQVQLVRLLLRTADAFR